ARAPVDGASQPLWFCMSEFRRPIAAEAAAHAGDPFAIDVAAGFEIIHRRGKSPLRAQIAAETRILTGARHVDGETSKAQLEQDVVISPAIFFPTVDAAPVPQHWRAIHP